MDNNLSFDDSFGGENNENKNLHQNHISSSDPKPSEPLPVEVVANILKYLSPIEIIRLERVSKLWKEASRYSWSFTKKVNIESPRFKGPVPRKHVDINKAIFFEDEILHICTLNQTIIKSLMSRVGSYVRNLYVLLDFDRPGEQRILSIFSKHCRNIQTLQSTIMGENYSKSTLPRLIKLNESLHTIHHNAGKCCVKPFLLRNWKSIYLDLPSPNKKTQDFKECEKDFIQMINNSESLERYAMNIMWTQDVMEALSGRKHLRDLGIAYIHDPEALFGVLKMKHFKDLRIVFSEEFLEDVKLNFFQGLSKHCHPLEYLGISLSGDPTQAIHTVVSLPNLTTLDLLLDDIRDVHLICLGKIKKLVLRRNSYNTEGLTTMILNSEYLEILAFDRSLMPSRIEEIRNAMTHFSRAITIFVHADQVEDFSKICENSTISIRKWSGSL